MPQRTPGYLPPPPAGPERAGMAGPDGAPWQRAARATGAYALVPLRAFLGVTFVFAGLQKLANPNFFNRSSPISIFSQMAGAARSSPLHAVLGHLLEVSTPLGVLIAVGEVAIGLGVLAGLLTRLAALAGMALSFGLFLTVSFHADPYYTGADIVFFFAFTPLLLGGAGEVLALDPLLRRRADELAGARSSKPRPGTGATAPYALQQGRPAGFAYSRTSYEMGRRQLLARAAGALAGAGAVAMGLDAAIGRLVGGAKGPGGTAVLGAGAGTGTGAGGTTSTSGGTGTASTAPAGAVTTAPGSGAPNGGTAGTGTAGAPSSTAAAAETPPGKPIGLAKEVAVGQAALFTDPSSGDPGIVIRLSDAEFVAYDAVCPHAGCTVGYSAGNSLIICPCHGSEFEPTTGAVIQGPAPVGLRPIQVAQGGNGDLYAV